MQWKNISDYYAILLLKNLRLCGSLFVKVVLWFPLFSFLFYVFRTSGRMEFRLRGIFKLVQSCLWCCEVIQYFLLTRFKFRFLTFTCSEGYVECCLLLLIYFQLIVSLSWSPTLIRPRKIPINAWESSSWINLNANISIQSANINKFLLLQA